VSLHRRHALDELLGGAVLDLVDQVDRRLDEQAELLNRNRSELSAHVDSFP
jgi:hypothetical protein